MEEGASRALREQKMPTRCHMPATYFSPPAYGVPPPELIRNPVAIRPRPVTSPRQMAEYLHDEEKRKQRLLEREQEKTSRLEVQVKTVEIEPEAEKERKKRMALWDLGRRREPAVEQASSGSSVMARGEPEVSDAPKSKEEAEVRLIKQTAGGAITRRTAKMARGEWDLCYAPTLASTPTPMMPSGSSTGTATDTLPDVRELPETTIIEDQTDETPKEVAA